MSRQACSATITLPSAVTGMVKWPSSPGRIPLAPGVPVAAPQLVGDVVVRCERAQHRPLTGTGPNAPSPRNSHWASQPADPLA
jgi:hypothetical protein